MQSSLLFGYSLCSASQYFSGKASGRSDYTYLGIDL